jgi:hypothetical protein
MLNIGDDPQGRLVLGTVATHNVTGSRVAIIGDSEIFQSGFGLDEMFRPRRIQTFPGDYIFVQRLLAWLMELPEDAWP